MGLAARKLRMTAPAAGGSGSGISVEVLADSPVGYWKLDETSGTTAADSSGNGYDMTYDGTYTLNQAGPGGDASVLLSTAGDLYRADTAALDVANVGTLECWVRRVTTGATTALVGLGNGAMLMRFNDNDKLTMLKSGQAQIGESSSTLTDTASWHHVAITKDGATCKWYIDGVDVTPGSFTNANMLDSTFQKTIGSDNFTGTTRANKQAQYIAHAAVYPTALSAARIAAHYAAA